VLPDVNEYGHLLVDVVGSDAGGGGGGGEVGVGGGGSGGGVGGTGEVDVIRAGLLVRFQVAATKDYWSFSRLTHLGLPADRAELKQACKKDEKDGEGEEDGEVDPKNLVAETCSYLEGIIPDEKNDGTDEEIEMQRTDKMKWGSVAFLTAVNGKDAATSFVLEPCEV
jgi:hypothetical protein